MAEHQTEPAAEPDSRSSAKNERPGTIRGEQAHPAAEPTMKLSVVRPTANEPTMEQSVVREPRAEGPVPEPAPLSRPDGVDTGVPAKSTSGEHRPIRGGRHHRPDDDEETSPEVAQAAPAAPAAPAATRLADPSATMELPHMVAAIAAAAIRDKTAKRTALPENTLPPVDTAELPRAVTDAVPVTPTQSTSASAPSSTSAPSPSPSPSSASASAEPAVSGEGRPAQQSGPRRWATKYGWLAAAVGIAAAVLLCSVPFVSAVAPTWNSAGPTATAARPTATAARPSVTPTASVPVAAAPSLSPSPTKASPTPRLSTAKPTPRRTQEARTPAQPVLLGPNSTEELYAMLNGYCRSTWGRKTRAWLRDWQGSAENNWVCREQGEPDKLINMTAACVYRYGDDAVASYTNRDDASSWRCYRG